MAFVLAAAVARCLHDSRPGCLVVIVALEEAVPHGYSPNCMLPLADVLTVGLVWLEA